MERNSQNELSTSSHEPIDTIDRLDELLSHFLDDNLSDNEVNELNQMILADQDARARSIEAFQLHTDLVSFFNRSDEATSPQQQR